MNEERTLILTLHVALDDEGDIDSMSSSIDSRGIPEDAVMPLVVQAVAGYEQRHIAEDFQKEAPLMNEEVMTALAVLNAKLRLVDAVMHMPDSDVIGMTIDLGPVSS